MTRLDPKTMHDLLTPLNAMLGLAGLLRDGVESPRLPAAECVQRIIHAGHRLEKQIRALDVPSNSGDSAQASETRLRVAPRANLGSFPEHRSSVLPARVLVVDDVADNRETLCANLRAAGFELASVEGGAECLEKALGWQPAAIVIDIHMPGMDGIETCRRLKQDSLTADIPVLFVTARHDEPTTLAALAVGGSDFIERSISPAILVARVSVLVNAHYTLARLREVAIADDLTGLFSRRYLFESLRQHAASVQRSGASDVTLSCLMLDVDGLKAINDGLGHAAGDAALRGVGEAIRCSIRSGDVATRFGGDEFVILLPATPRGGALKVAEKIRAAVAERSVDGQNITASLGVATCRISGRDVRVDAAQHIADGLLRKVDAALYQAKRAGKNRIVAA